MTAYHRPLKLPANRDALIERATSVDEGCVSVGGLASQLGQLRSGNAPGLAEAGAPLTGLLAIGRLIQLARREAGMSFEQFAHKVGISMVEVQAAEAGASTPEPRVLHALSEKLDISYQKLLTLAGLKTNRDEVLEREVLKYAASSGPMDKLNKIEAQALHDLLRLLHD